jgi:hypothetical protein
MIETKESDKDGRSGREEGVPGRKCTESESDEAEFTAEIRTMVYCTDEDQSSREILFCC